MEKFEIFHTFFRIVFLLHMHIYDTKCRLDTGSYRNQRKLLHEEEK